MRVTMDHLIANNEMEWQGTLRATYEKYLHPDVIDTTSDAVYQLIGEDKVIDLFQFSTQIGIETAKKVKPTNLIELAAANSLMRLLSDSGDSPIDTFVKHKNNINLWYQEMRGHQLSEEEIKIMENHLLKFNGVADTQELVMLMSMANDIAGFGVKDANKLRKAIAKPKKMKEELATIKEKFFKQGQELGTSLHLLSYVWDVQISRQLSYSFSILHTLAYSVVALQEVNLNLKYDPIYWQTACLTVNSGSMSDGEDGADIDTNDASASILDEKLEELDGSEIDGFTMNKQGQVTSVDIDGQTVDLAEDKNTKKQKAQSTDYGKIAAAIGNMQSRGVKIALPLINKASFGFTPDVKNQQIIFGLKGINGIGDDAVQLIIKNRPYNSLEDFIERMYDSSLIKRGQMIQLIKAGCFEEFGDRITTMETFINHIYEKKEKVTMQNFSMLMKNKLIPDDFKYVIKLFNFRKYVMKNVVNKEEKNKRYLLDKVSLPFFSNNFSSEAITEEKDGFPIISEKIFKKEFDKKLEDFKEWIKGEEVLNALNQKLYENEWNSVASGTVSSWEMDALSFYYTEHELAHFNKNKYEVVNFNDMPEEPEIVEMMKFKNGAERPKFKLGFIIGTVLDKNKTRHTVTLLTPDGVVTVKYYDGAFSHYNKQVSKPKEDGTKQIIEKSWFSRGNKLVIQGYRRGSQFKPHKYFNSPTKHTTLLITDVDQEGNLQWIEERKEG